jgi:HSP20 family protein
LEPKGFNRGGKNHLLEVKDMMLAPLGRFEAFKDFTTFEPFRDLMTMQQRINRMLDAAWPRSGQTELAATSWTPSVDIYERPEEIVIEAELPGLTKENVTVNLENNVLTIQGERKLEREDNREDYHRIERAYGSFMRSFTLPSHINSEKIDAEFKDGVCGSDCPSVRKPSPSRFK